MHMSQYLLFLNIDFKEIILLKFCTEHNSVIVKVCAEFESFND